MAKASTEGNALMAVVRLRSSIGLRHEAEETLAFLNLTRPNHAVIVDKRPAYLGMLQKAKDAITWGEIDAQTLARLLRTRGRLEGNRPLSDEYLAGHTDYKSIDEFATAVIGLKVGLSAIPKLKKVFRLHPPSKGYHGSVKRSVEQSGELGYRGAAVNELITRMT
jgi:large subunit ribosomal protein L30